MNEILPFAFERRPVRTVIVGSATWFVATDLCDLLGFTNQKRTLRRLATDQRGVQKCTTLGGDQTLSVVSESGLYTLIAWSRRPFAESFRRWVEHEVLPSIMRTGRYDRLGDAFALPGAVGTYMGPDGLEPFALTQPHPNVQAEAFSQERAAVTKVSVELIRPIVNRYVRPLKQLQ